ncbi:MAG: hypothetical protein JWN44_4326 [Myxococcales bacterium]|nr:hypothetical protein [Myxococcales bacterium]
MTEFLIVHEFETDTQRFWRIFLDNEFQNEMYRGAGMKRSEVRREDCGDRTVIVGLCVAERQLPAIVGSLLGGKQLGYTETLTFHKDRAELEQQIEMAVLPDRIRFTGKLTVEKLADDHVRRSYAGAINVNIGLIGKKIEQSTVKEMKRTHDHAAELMRAWLAKAAA